MDSGKGGGVFGNHARGEGETAAFRGAGSQGTVLGGREMNGAGGWWGTASLLRVTVQFGCGEVRCRLVIGEYCAGEHLQGQDG